LKKYNKFWEELIAYFPWYDTGHIENEASNNSSIVACVFVTAVRFLPNRCLAMIGRFLPSRCPATTGGYIQTHRLMGGIFSLLSLLWKRNEWGYEVRLLCVSVCPPVVARQSSISALLQNTFLSPLVWSILLTSLQPFQYSPLNAQYEFRGLL
jgi:hypothetical protein